MDIVLFTKLFRGCELEEIATTATDLGVDGIDLLIRPGHQLEPTAPERIPEAVRFLEGSRVQGPEGNTGRTVPARMPTERLLAGCAEAGIGLIRLGYWHYDPHVGYAAGFETARRQLDELERLAERAGVRLALQLHGGTLHASGCQAAALLAGHDPTHIGAYPDPGNQTVQDGREDWRFTFDVLRPWLCCVGVKNGGWFPADLAPSGQRRWRSDWYGIADGMVPWDEILASLTESGYDGFLSFHSHYEVPLTQALAQTHVDLEFVRRQLAQRPVASVA